MNIRLVWLLGSALAVGWVGCDTPQYTDAGGDSSLPDGSACNAPQTVCGSTCTTLQDDPSNCGKCGTVCSTGSACVSGVCTSAETLCQPDGGAPYYANTQTDNANCGACGNACATPGACSKGHCCGAGQTYCSTACTDTRSDTNNCNTCGNACPAQQSCVAGGCLPYPTSCTNLLVELGAIADGGGPTDGGGTLPDGATAPPFTYADGDYWIDPDGTGPIKPFVVRCVGMDTATPKEYLPLVHSWLTSEPNSNFVKLGAGAACPCAGSAYFQYTALRIDPATLTIDVNDHSFTLLRDPTVAACWLTLPAGACVGTFQNVQYGTPWDCTCKFSIASGQANVDLRGTGFSVASNVAWMQAGYHATFGGFSEDDAGTVINAAAGGCCGGDYPEVTLPDGGLVNEIILKQN